MTTTEILGELQRRGVQLEAHGNRIRFRPGEVVTPDLVEALKKRKAEILAVLRFDPAAVLRQALASLFLLTAGEADGLPRPKEARAAVEKIFAACERLKPADSERIYQAEAESYYRQHGRCPTCGLPGVFHSGAEA